MNELALFAGAGGGILGGRLLGWRTRCAVEINAYARRVLLSRQKDGTLERFPIWDDIKTFDGKPWMGAVDVVSGGFPCQDISSAGKRGGLAGGSSGLWFEMLRVIDESKPKFVFAENSNHLRTNGLGTVIKGLDGLGYDARWCVLGARHIGAPHQRNRMWILARNPNMHLKPTNSKYAEVEGVQGMDRTFTTNKSSWWDNKPAVGRVADGMAHRMDRLRRLGNGQVPRVAEQAFKILSDGWV